MLNAIVAGSVVLALSALYILAKLSKPRPQSLRHPSKGWLRRALRIAIHRAARHHEQWLTPVAWNARYRPSVSRYFARSRDVNPNTATSTNRC
jgi:hypothetical protein